MRLQDLATSVADQMRQELVEVEIPAAKGVKKLTIIDMASGNQRVLIDTDIGLLTFERLTRRHRVAGIAYKMVHRNHEVVRILRGNQLSPDGVVNGRYVEDVELECTKLAFPTVVTEAASKIS